MNFSGYACDKPTSRVLNPPGGRSNNIFGAYEEPVASNRNKQTNVLNDNSNQQSADNNNQMSSKTDRTRSNIFCEQPTQQVNNNNKQRRGFNPITGKPYDEEEERKQPAQHQQPEQVQHQQQHQQQQQQNQQPEGQQPGPANNYHSSTRIFHPPGGKSSKLW